MNTPVKGPVVTRRRLDLDTYAIESRRTGMVVATVLYDKDTGKWDWRLSADARPKRASKSYIVRPKLAGTEDTLTEAQAVVEYLVRRHNLDGSGG